MKSFTTVLRLPRPWTSLGLCLGIGLLPALAPEHQARAANRVWAGASTNLPPQWDDPDNWANQAVPADDDDVVIGFSTSPSAAVNILGVHKLKSLAMRRSSLNGTTKITVGSLTCEGSGFNGVGTLTITDAGSIATGSGGEPGMSLSGSWFVANSGSVSLARNASIFFLAGTNFFRNLGVVTFGPAAGISGSGGSFINESSLRAEGGSNEVTLHAAAFINRGTVELLSGNLRFTVGSVVTGGGSWFTDDFFDTFIFEGCKVGLDSATFAGPGAVSFQSGTLTVTNTVRVNNLNVISGGAIDGPGTLELSGSSFWGDATLRGGGGVQVLANAELFLVGLLVEDGRTFTNFGTVTQKGAATLRLANGAQFYNHGGAMVILDNSGGAGFVDTGGPAPSVFHNQGTLTTTAHTNQFQTTFLPVLENDGVLDLHSALVVRGGGSFRGGAFVSVPSSEPGSNAPPEVVLDFHGGTNQWGGGSFFGPVIISGGTVLLGSRADSVTLAETVRLDGGLIDGPGGLGCDEFRWRFGTLQGTGGIHANQLFVLEVMDGTRHWHGGTVYVNADGVWGGGDIDAGDGARMVIGDKASFLISSDRVWTTSGTSSTTIENRGDLHKTANGGTTTVGADLINSGTVRQDSGILRFLKSFTQNAGQTLVGSNSTIQCTTFSNNSGTFGGNGRILGQVVNSGTLSPGRSPGVLTVDGPFSQFAPGSLEIEIGGMVPGSTYDRLDITGAAALGGVLSVKLLNGFVPVAGDRFEVARFSSRTGTFPVNEGLLAGQDLVLLPVYSFTNLVLVATNLLVLTPTLGASHAPGGSLILSWDSVADQSYQIEASEDLINWAAVTSVTATGPRIEFTPPDQSAPARFYRLR